MWSPLQCKSRAFWGAEVGALALLMQGGGPSPGCSRAEQGLLCNHLLKWWGTSSVHPGHFPAWIISHWRDIAESRALPRSVLLSPEYPRLAPLLANGIYPAYVSLPSIIHTALLLYAENIHGLSKLSLYVVWGIWLLSFISYSSVSFSFSFPNIGAPAQVLRKSTKVTNS